MKSIAKWFFVLYGFLGIMNAQVSFVSNGQQLNNCIGRSVILNDFNGDGILDAFVANEDDYRVYYGDGQGNFIDSGQRLPIVDTFGKPNILDINGDGKIEVITGGTVWLIDSVGNFTAQPLSIESSEIIDLGTMRFADLNGDGFVDLFAFRNYIASRVYLNDGNGNFHDTGQRLGDGTIGSGQLAQIALGDINGDGFIDAVTAGWKWNGSTQCPNHVWLNDGLGNFHDSGQLLDEGQSHVHGLALCDLNSDSRLDIIMGIQDATRSGTVYLNYGNGNFVKGQNFSGAGGEKVTFGDFNKDGYPDIFMPQSTPPSRVWLNNGDGTFFDSGVRLGSNCSWDADVGDLNADGRLDVFTVGCIWSGGLSPAPAQIWLNTTPTKYLGEIPPGVTPKIFAPGVVSQGDVNTCSFSPDGMEMVFTRWNGNYPSLFYSKFDSSRWTSPAAINFTGNYEMEAIFAPYGNQMFFASGDMAGGKYVPDDIWVVEKDSGEWKNPAKVSGINTGDYEFYATLTLDTAIYFQRTFNGIFSSKYQNGGFSTPIKLGDSINSPGGVSRHPCISKDGSCLVFEKSNGASGNDIFVSFQKSDKSWSVAVNLGSNINTAQAESQPVLSPDGKFLFFTRGNPGSIYWVRIDNDIDSLKESVLNPSKLEEVPNRLPKGLKLNQNYPNPFNPSTNICYQLPVAGNVRLSIYNLIGQRIKTLVDSFQSAGEHIVIWDGTEDSNEPVSSGVYFYSLQIENNRQQKKMILTR